mmetsp:Transcript_114133/g.333634  ORF Transcript_114133/g.333634 Transcript_114133/m.333634 type:complete len:271 (+) Transcript_114133:229-1041(+)
MPYQELPLKPPCTARPGARHRQAATPSRSAGGVHHLRPQKVLRAGPTRQPPALVEQVLLHEHHATLHGSQHGAGLRAGGAGVLPGLVEGGLPAAALPDGVEVDQDGQRAAVAVGGLVGAVAVHGEEVVAGAVVAQVAQERVQADEPPAVAQHLRHHRPDPLQEPRRQLGLQAARAPVLAQPLVHVVLRALPGLVAGADGRPLEPQQLALANELLALGCLVQPVDGDEKGRHPSRSDAVALVVLGKGGAAHTEHRLRCTRQGQERSPARHL